MAGRKTRVPATVRVAEPASSITLKRPLWAKAPYHPQYLRRGTRFDAPLRDPLRFGFAPIKAEALGALGTQPSPDSVAHVRFLATLSSNSAKQGQPVEAVVTTPLFSPEHQLVLPEGTRLQAKS